MEYKDFIKNKHVSIKPCGFDIDKSRLNPMAFDWKKDIVRWALKKGAACLFWDCYTSN